MLQPWDHTRIGFRYLTETDLDFEDSPDISGVDLPDFDPLRDFIAPSETLDLGLKMPQEINGAIHHQWNDDLAILGSLGWSEWSEFGKIQVGVDSSSGGISTEVDADFRDVWHFGLGAEYQYKPGWELTAGISYDTSMSSSRTRPIVIPLGNMYRYAVGFKHKRRDDLTVGGGYTFLWEGNLAIEDSGGVYGKYKSVALHFLSIYAQWK
jgi:long-chain fatty acid transport protein